MTEQKFPHGWDQERVRRLISECEQLSEDEQTAEDEKAAEGYPGQTVITVPESLLPDIRHLLANRPAI